MRDRVDSELMLGLDLELTEMVAVDVELELDRVVAVESVRSENELLLVVVCELQLLEDVDSVLVDAVLEVAVLELAVEVDAVEAVVCVELELELISSEPESCNMPMPLNGPGALSQVANCEFAVCPATPLRVSVSKISIIRLTGSVMEKDSWLPAIV